MPVTDVTKDPTALTMTITSEWDTPPEAVWQLWSDPRKLERWWGPPTFPATFVEHDLRTGGRATYFMTGPDGEQHHGWWRIISVDEQERLEVEDGFADADGNADESLPTTMMTVTLTKLPSGGTQMVLASRFPSTEAMEQMVAMGMDDGIREAMSQIDAILAEN